jgi:hypothetical protein
MSTATLDRQTEYRTLERFPGYRFGSDGSIWSAWHRGPQRKMYIGEKWKRLRLGKNRGYCVLSLRARDNSTHRNVLAHRLILEAFAGPCPANCEARHFPDATRSNNAISNLIWGTRHENHQDKWPQGSMPHGEGHQNAILTVECVKEIRRLYSQGVTQTALGKKFRTQQTNISMIVNRKAWAWLP